MAKITVIGGGFAGLNFILNARNSNHEITLIDRTNHHLFQPLLYQVATAVLSPADIAVPLRDIVKHNKNIRVVLGDVSEIDREKKCVILKSKKKYEFDYLVVAVGATHSYFGHHEWAKHSTGLKVITDALNIRENILMAFEKAERETSKEHRQEHLNFVVVGGGPTGVEMAGSIADIAYRNMIKDFRNFNTNQARIYLIEAGKKILPMYSEALSQKAHNYLIDFGVIVRTNEMVTNIEKGVVSTNKDVIKTTNIIWAAGNEASPLLKSLHTDLDRQGRAIVNNDCSIKEDPSIFVIGDAAHCIDDKKQALPGIAPVAIQQGKYVAKIIKKNIPPSKRKPFKYFDKGMMATIGKSKAIAQTGSIELSGWVAWLAWSFIHLIYLIGYRTRILVTIEWVFAYVFNKKGSRIIYRHIK